MKRTFVLVFAVLALPVVLTAGEPRVVFEDSFKGKLGEGWTWLRYNPKAWIIAKEALDILVEPVVAR